MIIIFFSVAVQAQNLFAFGSANNLIRPVFMQNIYFNIPSEKKWSLNKYTAISTSFVFFKGGNATVVSAPVGLQLNRKLNNNFYAFAGVALAPSYINFNQSFNTSDFNKLYQKNNVNAIREQNLG